MKLFKPLYFFLFCCFVVLAFEACTKVSNESPIPSLEYNGYSKFKAVNGKDSFIVININFTDGDGDVGLSESDSVPPFRYGSKYFYNLFAEFYSIENDVPSKITSSVITPDTLYKDTVNYSQRLKNLTPEGKNKAIKGKIELLTPFFLIDLSSSKPDSIFYEIVLFDRSLNQSQIIRTPIIQLNL